MQEQLVAKIADILKSRRQTLTCAESCTGGGISYTLTAIPGSSLWFEQGIVTYSNMAKARWLGVDEALIVEHGAVSEIVVSAMLDGLLARTSCDYGIAVSGIAGPSGGTTQKPVGTVCIAWGSVKEHSVLTYLFRGDRQQIREQAITQALLNIYRLLENSANTV